MTPAPSSKREHPTSSALWDDLGLCGHIFQFQQFELARLVPSPIAPIASDTVVPCKNRRSSQTVWREKETPVIFMCHGSGAYSKLRCSAMSFSLWTAQVLQRLQDLVSIALTQLDRALLEVQKGIEMCWTKWMASIGQVVDTRVRGKVQKWKCSEEASPNWSLTKAYDGSVDQCGCGAQQAVRRCAVVFRLDRFVHGKRLGSHRRCSTTLECEGVATSLLSVFPEERCKFGGADDVVAEA